MQLQSRMSVDRAGAPAFRGQDMHLAFKVSR